MATRIKTENSHVIARFDPTARYATHVELYEDGAVRVRWNGSTAVTNFDIGGSESSEVTLDDQVRLTHFTGDDVTSNGGEFLIEIGNRYPVDTELASDINTLYPDSTTYPVYVVWPTGTNQAPLTATRQSAGNRRRRGYVEWKAAQYDEAVKFRDMILDYLVKLEGATPCFEDVESKGTVYLKSAWQAVETLIRSPNTHPREMVRILKALQRGPVGAEDFWSYAASVQSSSVPNVPVGKRLWVNTSTYARTTLTATERVGTDALVSTLNYNFNWLTKGDSDGIITFNQTAPRVGQAVRVTLSDSDGGVRNRTQQWYTVQSGTQTIITGETTVRYTPVDLDVGKQLRCIVSYDDRFATGRSATGTLETAVVGA